MALPEFEAFSIPRIGITLRDSRGAPRLRADRCHQIAMQVIHRFLENTRPDVRTCGIGQPVSDDSSYDMNLDAVNLMVVADDTTLLGSMILYNIEIESRNPDLTVISPMIMPACRGADSYTLRHTWSFIMQELLERDISAAQRKIDIIEWRLPTRIGHRWNLSPAERAAQKDDGTGPVSELILGDLTAAGHLPTKTGDVPTKIRRAGA